MELTQKQIDKFKKIHEKYGCFDDLPDDQIKRIATGIASYYSTLFKIYKKNLNLSDNITVCVKVDNGFEMFGDEKYNISVTQTVLCPSFLFVSLP